MDFNLPPPQDEGDHASVYHPRRGHRFAVGKSTQMRSTEMQPVEVTVCDVSTGGFMAQCMRPVLIGSYVSLDLPGIGPVHAQVRWQVGTRLGGRFLDPVGLHRCDWISGSV
jgi:hypothetical protein